MISLNLTDNVIHNSCLFGLIIGILKNQYLQIKWTIHII